MGIAGLLQGRCFEEAQLQDGIRFATLSRCFRPEIGRGRAAHGLYRVHEFTKIELFGLTTDSEVASTAMLKEFTDFQVELYQDLGLHFRLLQMPTGELGASAFEKLDCEAWFPGRQAWGEISSASNCLQFQARRLPHPLSDSSGSLCHPHTLNATAAAMSRLLLALIESHARPSRTGNLKKLFLDLPKALLPFLSASKIPPVKSRQNNIRNFCSD